MSDVKEYMTDKKMTHCTEGNRSQRVKTEGHGDSKNGEQFLNANDHMFKKILDAMVSAVVQVYYVCPRHQMYG